MIKKFKNPIVFSLVLLPISLAGGFFTSIYLAESYDAQSIQKILSSAGLADISIFAYHYSCTDGFSGVYYEFFRIYPC